MAKYNGRASCSELIEIIENNKYIIERVEEDDEKCIVDFRHPKIKVMQPVSYFLSSVFLDRKTGFIETTVRSKVDSFKELYLDYCCEDSKHVCRPHADMENGILSVEAKFKEDSLKKFSNLLDELR